MKRLRVIKWRGGVLLVALVTVAVLPSVANAGQTAAAHKDDENASGRVPGDSWLRYADAAHAGFSQEDLDRAFDFGERRGAVAILVVSNGAVVASRGDIGRRLPIHSIRKSLLSALYGVYRDDLDLDLTLEQLGLDDEPALTPAERQARVVDLISARSGVYHAAAGEPSEMESARPERGSQAPDTSWWYNNWDFNAAGAVFERATGAPILTAFGERIAAPIGMQDFRVSDGYYNLEPAKSVHASFGMNMSTRDLARFGLLFARGGRWGRNQIVPGPWVDESTESHSDIDLGSEYGTGYGYMWWVDGDQGFAARGFGGHALAVYPADDLVLVVRADTYHDRFLANRSIERLFREIRRARHRAPVVDPPFVPFGPASHGDGAVPAGASGHRARYAGEVQLESGERVTVGLGDEGLTLDYGRGAFNLRAVSGGRFVNEDTGDPVILALSGAGTLGRVLTEPVIYMEAAGAVRRGDVARAVEWIETAVRTFPRSPDAHYNLARALNGTGHRAEAMSALATALDLDPGHRAAASLLASLRWRRYGPPAAALLVGLSVAWWAVRRWRRAPRRAG